MQTAGDLVRIAVELAARVQDRHDDLGGGATQFVIPMNIRRDPPPLVDAGDGIVGVNRNLYAVTPTRQSFVYGVVDNFKNHMVQAGAIAGVADVHTRAFAYRFEALQYLDTARAIFWRVIAREWFHQCSFVS